MQRYAAVSLLVVILFSSPGPATAQDASLEALLKAIAAGDEAAVTALLDGEASVTAAAPDGVTPLHAAAYAGSAPITTLLLERGADVNAKATGDVTPLHIAGERCSDTVIPLLLEAGAEVEAANGEGATALHMAAMQGCSKAVPQLIEAGATVGATAMHDLTPLHVAAQSWNEKTVTALLDAGAAISAATKEGYSPLHLAILQKKWKTVDVLVERGASVDAQDAKGETPVHLIIKASYETDRAKTMIGKSGALDLATKNGVTAVYIAAAKGESELLALLLEKGADPNLKDSDGVPPLAAARFEGNTSSVKLLEAAGAVDAEAFFYLYNAAMQGSVGKLRKALAMPSAKDAKTRTAPGGVTPLHAAANAGSELCVVELLDAGWAVDVQDDNGNTALHMAVVERNDDVYRILRAAGASNNVANTTGTTPLQYAEQLGIAEVLTKTSLTPALIAAAEAGDQGPIDAFLDGGGDADAHDYFRGLLFVALKHGKMDLAAHLAARGASLDFAPPGGEPVLVGAVRGRNRLALDWLMAGGAKLHVTGRLSAEPLHFAAATPWKAGVEVLLDAGVDPNIEVASWGLTPLHYAVLGGDIEIVRLLLDKGADPTKSAKPQGTPLHWATKEGRVEIARLLIERGASVNAAVDEYGDTPLHEAASGVCVVSGLYSPWHDVDEETSRKNKPAMVQLLIDSGAKLDPLTNYGATPLDNAGDPEVIKILEAAGATSPLKDARERRSP